MKWLLLFFHLVVIGQNDSLQIFVEEMPQFACPCETNCNPDKELLIYIHNNLRITSSIENTQIGSKIRIQFVVEKDGCINAIEVVEGQEIPTNIVDVFAQMPLWIPGKQNGIAQNVLLSIPIQIHLE